MNVFVLCTGRCGSLTFSKACGHITNFTSGHETRVCFLGSARLDYPDNHIEVDNRLSWLLGRLDEKYGDDAVYVHLHRNYKKTALSYSQRYHKGIMRAYGRGIIMGGRHRLMPVATDLVTTVTSNINLFLRDKTHAIDFQLERAKVLFPKFWRIIGAKGNLKAAVKEFSIRYNAGKGKRR